jgi:hypothetical protein
MKRILQALALASLLALLSACQTAPTAPPPAAEPVAKPSTVDLLLDIRKKELEIERDEQMAWLKFAVESGSDYVKGFVMGRSKGGAQSAPAGGTSQAILQAQAHADEVALRREEMAERNSLWNRSLQVYDRAERLVMFGQGLKFKKFEIRTANDQERYRFDTVRGAQSDGFAAGSGATLGGVNAGHGTTMGGFNAARQPLPATPSADESTEAE